MAVGFELDESTGKITRIRGVGRPVRPADDAPVKLLEAYANSIVLRDALGYFPRMSRSETREVGKVHTTDEIEWFIRMGRQHQSVPLLLRAASLLGMYSGLYCFTSLGEDKSIPLKQEICVLEEAIAIDRTSVDLHLKLVRALLAHPQTRDCARARLVVDGAVLSGALSVEDGERLQELRDCLERWERKARRNERKAALMMERRV